jgi:hypothetical protein
MKSIFSMFFGLFKKKAVKAVEEVKQNVIIASVPEPVSEPVEEEQPKKSKPKVVKKQAKAKK